jgi:hypothetical protein
MMAVANVDEAAAHQWRDGIMALYNTGQRHMTLDGLALTAFLGFRSHLEERRFIGGDLEGPTLVEFSTKCESSVARLALIFALADNADHVTLDHMTSAIRVGHYWVGQMLGLAGDYKASTLDQRVKRFITWIDRKHPDGGPVKVRDVERSGTFRRSNYDDRDSILEVFERAEQLGLGSIDWTSERSVAFRRVRATAYGTHGNSCTESETDPSNRAESGPTYVLSRTHKEDSETHSLSISHSLIDERATSATTDPDPVDNPEPDDHDPFEGIR